MTHYTNVKDWLSNPVNPYDGVLLGEKDSPRSSKFEKVVWLTILKCFDEILSALSDNNNKQDDILEKLDEIKDTLGDD